LTNTPRFANIALMEKEEIISDDTSKRGKVYELSFIFVPLLAEEVVPVKFSELKNIISDSGGQFIVEELPRLINLAYVMEKTISNKNHKFNTGYFGWVKFEIGDEGVENIAKKLKFNDDILRCLLIKTVRENTLAPKKNIVRERGSRKSFDRAAHKEESVPMDKEQVDKEIEKLVV